MTTYLATNVGRGIKVVLSQYVTILPSSAKDVFDLLKGAIHLIVLPFFQASVKVAVKQVLWGHETMVCQAHTRETRTGLWKRK